MPDHEGMTVGLAGGAYMPFPVSAHREAGFLSLVKLFQGADGGQTRAVRF